MSKMFNWIHVTQLYIYFFSAITHCHQYHGLVKSFI